MSVDLLMSLLAATSQAPDRLVFSAQSVIPAILAQDPALERANQLMRQAVQKFQQGDGTGAAEAFQQARQIYQQLGDRRRESYALGNLATVYLELKEYQKAIQPLGELLALTQALNDRQGQADALEKLGRAYRALKDYANALPIYEQYLKLARESGNPTDLMVAYGSLGLVYDALGKSDQAIGAYQQALKFARETKSPRGEQAALGNLGTVYLGLEDYARAIDVFQQALKLAQREADHYGEAKAMNYLGRAYYYLADYDRAIGYYEQGRKIALENRYEDQAGLAARGLGNVYYYKRDLDRAIQYHQEDLTLARKINNRLLQGLALGNLGLAYMDKGDLQKAIDLFQQDLAIAREFNKREAEGQVLNNLGNLYYRLGQYDRAIEHYQQALPIMRQVNYGRGEGIVLTNLGVTYVRLQQYPQAEASLRSAISVWDKIRGRLGENDQFKVSIFEQFARIYTTLQEVLAAQNQPEAALEISEQGRARAFAELLARRRQPGKTFVEPLTPIQIADMRRIARERQATLVEYSVITDDITRNSILESLETELFIWVVQPSGQTHFRRSSLKALDEKNLRLKDLVAASRSAIGVRGITFTESPEELARAYAELRRQRQENAQLQQQYQMLIQPIADLLPTDPKARVIIIPHRSLFFVPFAALQDQQGTYLIERHTLTISPSIQILDLNRRPPATQPGKVLIVGNPTMPSLPPGPGRPAIRLNTLPGAETEAKAIAKLLGTSPLLGAQATETAVRQQLSQARIIHLATHGLLNEVIAQGIPGAIALAASGKEDGFLTTSDILDLQLQAELVVLSACDTGRGNITEDGIIGLSRAFISAGVPTVIVSLWQVPDQPTAFLMTQFYETLQQNPDKAQAMRQAMLTTLKEYPDPKAWAAFTLIGEP
ncbi:hypothetical protein BST81_02725 [Leptolyngbya sp. 'hensonii']|uniref:CHAT domain-containing tetratricopeptide repeat protein n=1 Tax=Leptolyngbya sp. 'hensonii' TaxID=1922337 RepID=UPI0009502696|nr:CHAT domain-containing protein [Leptolyngbya sp. 'hensonii']OLP20005.1 hypothetical protein BST81_02725 [Leptolyngbya sp. 'hensonii']